jgi:hypothetical protein
MKAIDIPNLILSQILIYVSISQVSYTRDWEVGKIMLENKWSSL